jgi:hypothetical protein
VAQAAQVNANFTWTVTCSNNAITRANGSSLANINVSFPLTTTGGLYPTIGCNNPNGINCGVVVNVSAYGALCNGFTDDSLAFMAAITQAQLNTSPTEIDYYGICMVNGLVISGSNVTLRGTGGGRQTSTQNIAPAAALECNANGATVLSIVPASTLQTARNNILDTAILSNSQQCAQGLYIKGSGGGYFRNLYLDGFTTSSLNVHGGAISAANGNTIANIFDGITVYAAASTAGIGILCDGDLSAGTGNCDFNDFRNVSITNNNAAGFKFGWSDANSIESLHVVNSGGGGAYGLVFGCGSHSNRVDWATLSTGMDALGSTTCTGGHIYDGPSGGSTVFHYDIYDNGNPNPVCETGANLMWTDDHASVYYQCKGSVAYPALAWGPAASNGQVPADGDPIFTTFDGNSEAIGCRGTGQTCPVFFYTTGQTDGDLVKIGTTGLVLDSASTNVINVATASGTGLNINFTGGTAGNLLAIQLAGSPVATFANGGGLILSQKITANGGQASTPQHYTGTCSLSTQQTCNSTQTVVAGSVCNSQFTSNPAIDSTHTLVIFTSLASTTLTTTVNVAQAANTTATPTWNTLCL